MSATYITADLHLGHKNVALWRGFTSVLEHDEFIIHEWNSVVSKRDTVYILGDITMHSEDSYPLLNRLAGRKIVVMGNHDDRKHSRQLLKYVDQIAGAVKYKHAMLTHIPIHSSELKYRFKLNIHGHLHKEKVKKFFGLIEDKRYKCVSLEQTNYKPLTFNQIINGKINDNNTSS